jgi:quercetin 2,3-dioxygenase
MTHKNRSVKKVLFASTLDMGGMPIRQPFPYGNMEHVDPFLLLHHAVVKVPTHIETKHAGVGPHPHRGFSPVSFIFKGGVHHRDSRGNDSVIYEGGTQWMNAGMGITHSERPPNDIHEKGGIQELIQLWVNTPSQHKMDQPEYFPLTAEDTPTLEEDNGKVKVHVIAGEMKGLKGKIPTFTPINAATIYMSEGGKTTIDLPDHHNAFIYILNGKIHIEGYGLADHHNAIVFNNDGDHITIEAKEDTRILLMSGVPLKEKVVAQGPFVMNSETQIMEAYRDYQMGKMGVLIED